VIVVDARFPLVVGPAAPSARRSAVRPLLLAVGLALVVALAAVGVWRLLVAGSLLPAPAPAVESVVVPGVATDGVVSFTIPKGAAVAQQAGAEPYLMPDVMRLSVGDKLVVRNEDDYPHMIFALLVQPSETGTMTFDEPGTTAYSSGCTANGGTMNSFTSVVVSASAEHAGEPARYRGG